MNEIEWHAFLYALDGFKPRKQASVMDEMMRILHLYIKHKKKLGKS